MILLHHPLPTCPPSVPTCHAGDKGARIYDLDSQSSPPPPWKEPPMPIMGMLSRACVRASQDAMHAGDSICRQADCSVYLDESSFITQFLPGPFLLHRLRACRTLAQVQTIAQRRVPCVPVTDMSLTVSPHLTPEGSMTALSSDTSPGSGTICSMACALPAAEGAAAPAGGGPGSRDATSAEMNDSFEITAEPPARCACVESMSP